MPRWREDKEGVCLGGREGGRGGGGGIIAHHVKVGRKRERVDGCVGGWVCRRMGVYVSEGVWVIADHVEERGAVVRVAELCRVPDMSVKTCFLAKTR